MDLNKAAQELGRRGGLATKASKSPDYYRIIGAMGGRKKAKNKRKVMHSLSPDKSLQAVEK